MPKQKKVSKKVKTVAKQQPRRRLPSVGVRIGITVLLLLFAFLVAPVRNSIAGVFLKRDVTLVVTETRTGEVVQEAVVAVGGGEYKTSDTGSVTLKRLRPGTHTVTIEKPFYEPKKVAVQISAFTSPRQVSVRLEAKGRLAKVVVKNKLSGLPVNSTNIKTDGGSYARTNERGEATVVLRFEEQQATATISGETIATKTVVIRPAQDALTNLVEVMPSGRMVYLSGSTQTPDVTSIGLDGNNPKQIVAASGFEPGSATQLFPHAKWQWAVLYSKRDSSTAAPRLLNTTTGELAPMATENALYTPVAWVGDVFIYRAKTNTLGQFYTETEEMRAYDLSTRSTRVLYTTRWEGTSPIDYAQERIGEAYGMSGGVYFETSWRASYYYGSRLADKKMTISYIDEKQEVRVLQDWPAGYNASIRSVRNMPNKLIVFAQLDGVKNTFWEVSKDVSVESAVLTTADFTNKQHPIYVVSPNGVSALWKGVAEQAQYIFVGDSSAKGARVFSPDQSYARYKWYSDDYVLLQKSADIYIIGRGGVKDRVVPVRIVSDAAAPL